MLQKKWVLKNQPNKNEVDQLQNELKVHWELCALLVQRGIVDFENSKRYFRPSYDYVHDPFLMQNMANAVARLSEAISKNEKILVYGDYDVDGTTAVAIVYSFLRKIHSNLSFYVPDRNLEGYGISQKSIDYASDNDFGLIIALDCGIKAVEKVAYAKTLGIDYIICDHHLPGDTIPDGIILNPKQVTCEYPFKELSGAGVGFKLIHAYACQHDIDLAEVYQYLDLLAISIGADMVPILDENRILAQFGMTQLNDNPRVGLKAILQESQVSGRVNMRDVGFKIGPRINAAGRLAHASKAVDLLITQSELSAEEGSFDVALNNSDRRALDEQTTKEALALLLSDDQHQNKKSTVIYKSGWHKGILGIVCNRLQEHYYRPTIVLSKNEDGTVTGSARSVQNYNIHDAITACSVLLLNYGGHAFAAGLSLKEDNVNAFITAFERFVSDTISPDLLVPKIHVDIPLALNDVTSSFFKILNQFEPFGVGNEQPIFSCTNVMAYLPTLRVVGKTHLKMDLFQVNNPTVRVPAIAFNQIHHYDEIMKGESFSIAYVLEANEWKGKTTIQALVKDIKLENK